MIVVDKENCDDIYIKINEKIALILEFFIDVCEDSNYEDQMETIFPSYFLRDEPEECKKNILELYEYSRDGFLHCLNPIKQYALYHLFEWYMEVTEEDLIIEAMTLDLNDDKERLVNYGIEDFKELMFEDHDFLDVDLYIHLFNMDPRLLKQYGVDLERYLELMPKDIRAEYVESQDDDAIGKTTLDEEELIINLIYSSIQRKQTNPLRLLKTSETELSDDIADYMVVKLNDFNLNIEREKPAGFALKDTGELDFFIHRTSNNIYEKIAIGENKEWGNFESQFKQLIGYMDRDIKFGFTILFNKTVQLKTIIKKRRDFLNEFYIDIKGKHVFKVNRIEELKQFKDVIITSHTNPEDGSEVRIYHFIINAVLPERVEAAKQARKKRR
ncbi:hypothetical protein [Bacillus luti]|uniref:hypothetical protein n=1 Tax=Bacillus luti TaxID=2026191 RepID=UPI003775300E